MEIAEAIKSRKSIRGFLPQPVPKEVLEEVLRLASHSPPANNRQPWEVAVIGGEVLKQLKQALFEAAKSGIPPDHDIPEPPPPELYLNRSRDLARRLYGILGIAREDREAREQWALLRIRFFDAPNALIFYQDRRLGLVSLLDIGLFLQSIMLAALAFGLGTCPETSVVSYPKILRRILNIPDEKIIVGGIAIGYPDWQQPANKLESPREPLESFARWHGF